ncbi:dihydroxyacetone kinase phosphoryl donor subunit DhaM [Oceanobacillus sp. FSL K6-2867]|uniref:dihydroxyacetone kinase phosphoryl donor subunit DhaM n=1 Tax=Oceanobacillus sp. FSL K6-2867 TaxID=2954748 RepID=UPI0030D8417F
MERVGIVLISHSSKIAEGLKELISQVITEVPVEAAGGTEENEIGTSIEKILESIHRADCGKGVMLFYDIGSAKMNAEIAIEMAESIEVMISEAPLVEGAYVGAVESGMAKSLQEVNNAVEKAF